MTDVLQSRVQTSSPEFQENHAHHLGLVKEVQEAVEAVRHGSEEAVARHHARDKLRAARSWSYRRWRPTTCTTGPRRAPGSSPASARSVSRR
ncbi:MAG: hypothetical protein ACYTGO_03280 [Planctomycetota bacterium]